MTPVLTASIEPHSTRYPGPRRGGTPWAGAYTCGGLAPTRTPAQLPAHGTGIRRVGGRGKRGDQAGWGRGKRCSMTWATPSSLLPGITWSTAASTSGCAFATAYDVPAQASMARSFGISPNATTDAGEMPCLAARSASADALVTPSALASMSRVPLEWLTVTRPATAGAA